MNNKDTKETNVLAQASILMVAGIITRIIGVLYRSPLTSVIGDEGNGYYGIAVNIYTMILLVSSFILVFSIERDVFGMSALTVVALDVMLSVADTAVNPTIKRTIKDKKKILCLFFNM